VLASSQTDRDRVFARKKTRGAGKRKSREKDMMGERVNNFAEDEAYEGRLILEAARLGVMSRRNDIDVRIRSGEMIRGPGLQKGGCVTRQGLGKPVPIEEISGKGTEGVKW